MIARLDSAPNIVMDAIMSAGYRLAAGHNPNNLMIQPNALIGRAAQSIAIASLLRRRDTRLLTLSGPGGVGKTRLALQAAADLFHHFADGVWFIDLAPISDPLLVRAAITEVLGVKEAIGQPLTASLKAYLRQ